MAENEKKTKEDAQAAAQAAPEKTSLLNKKNILILSALIIVVGAGAFAGIKMMAKPSKKDSLKKEEASHQPKKDTFIYSFKPLITNIAGTNASRFLKVTVSVQFEEKELEKAFDEKNAVFLDIMNTIFSTLSLELATEISQSENLKR